MRRLIKDAQGKKVFLILDKLEGAPRQARQSLAG
jgi:hypothetical protein